MPFANYLCTEMQPQLNMLLLEVENNRYYLTERQKNNNMHIQTH